MANKKITGIPEIDGILAGLNKQFEKDYFSMGPRIQQIPVFPSGSLALDSALGIGGFPQYGIVEIFGPTSKGKTSLGLQVASNYMKYIGEPQSKIAAFIDLERTTSLDLITGMGLDASKMLFLYPDTAEEALQAVENLALSGRVGLIMIDSVDAMETEKETKRAMDEGGVADLPRVMSKAMRSLSKVSESTKTLFLFINQIRMKITMYGDPETTSGGGALGYYANLRLRINSKPSVDQADTLSMKIKLIKNKYAPNMGREAECEFVCGQGIEEYLDTILFAKDHKIIRLGGQAVYLRLPGQEERTLCIGGKQGAREYFMQNPGEYQTVRNLCLEIGRPGAKAVASDTTEPEANAG